MDIGLIREIERLQVQLRAQEDPEDDGSGLPALPVDHNSLGRELRDALGDLLLARQQAKSLRESLRRKEEQNDLMRKVNEQVQTVQQKLVAKESELTRTHEETIRLSNELRNLKSERAAEQGQLEMLQWKLDQRDRDLANVDTELKTKDSELQQVTAGKSLSDAETERKINKSKGRQRHSGLLLFSAILNQWRYMQLSRTTRGWVMEMLLSKMEKKHKSKMQKAKAKVEEQIKVVQAQVAKVMETCRTTEKENEQLRDEKEDLEDKLDKERDKTEDLAEQLEHTEQEFEKLLGQLGA